MNKAQEKIELEKAKVKALFGENVELIEDIDKEHSVKCSNGTFIPKVEGDIRIFRGIPFALPPIGERRWKRPVSIPDSEKIFEAFYNGKSPIQTVINSERASYYPQSEDCLYLNVWVNDKDKSKSKSIMVFIHGGSYGWGGTADPLYDGYNFINLHPDVILITIAYRTGILGFIDLSYLEGGEEFADAPNLGILDQIEALRWVNKNGKCFGGDVNNITVFGESAGGGSVSILPIVNEAKGLFKRVIAESGSLALTYSKEECKPLTDLLISVAETASIDKLMKFTEEEIKAINEKLNEANNFPMRDGKLIPLNPYDAYKNGVTKDVDILIGTNANEMNYWIGELGGLFNYNFGMPIKYRADIKQIKRDEDKENLKLFIKKSRGNKVWRITEFYNEIMFRLPAIRQAEDHYSNSGNVYMYYWKEESKIPHFRACHAIELAYVFYNIEDTIYSGEKVDEELARNVSNMWVNFAKTGDPSLEHIKWEKYDENHRTLIIKKGQTKMINEPLKWQKDLLMPITDYMINPGYAGLSFNMSRLAKTKSVIKATLNTLSTKVRDLFN